MAMMQNKLCYLRIRASEKLISRNFAFDEIKDDHAFSLLHQEFSQIFGIMSPLVPVVKILEKNIVLLGKSGVARCQPFRGSDRRKFQGKCTLATSNIRLFLFFGEKRNWFDW